VAGLQASSTYSKLERECGTTGCSDREHLDAINRGKSLQTVADIGLIIGIGGAVTSGALFYFGIAGSETAVSVVKGGGVFRYRGQF